jgi:glycosyltransferase involved in cell wall biosynthesis
MKILMLNFDYKGLGTYYRSFDWARYLTKAGHEVTIVCLSSTQKLSCRTTKQHEIRILETPNFLNGSKVWFRLSAIWGWSPIDIAFRIREILRSNYDIVHTFEHHPNVTVPIYLTPRERVPVLVSDWCDNYGEGGFRDYNQFRLNSLYKRAGFPLRWLLDRVEKDLRIKSQAVTVISNFLMKRALDLGVSMDKICLIQGSVDTDSIQPIKRHDAKARVDLPQYSKIVAFLGSAQFDVDLALEALSLIVRQNPEILFLIIGKKMDFVTSKASELGISSNIIQTGWCSDENLPIYLSAADAFLLPMKRNPVNEARWPNKIGEYMAASRPTVCTNVGDVPQLLEKEQIGLVSEPQPEDFAEKILLILRNDELNRKMGKKARRVAETRFSLNFQGAKLESIYQRITQNQSHRGQSS